MSVNTSVTRRAGQVLSISIGNMLTRLGITESFGKTKVDYIYIVLFFADSNQKIIRLDISVKEVSTVDKLDSLKLKSS